MSAFFHKKSLGQHFLQNKELLEKISKIKELENEYTSKTISENYNKILLTMLPIIPHFASECLEMNKFKIINNWPNIDEKLLIDNEAKIVIQINGKKRGLLNLKKDADEKTVLSEIKKEKVLDKYIENKKFKKVIFVKNKILNVII